ncbi:hypothetical protein MA16_Dca023292 [Dendrobium catenatum]|uniref:Uncharacterized protein n=1 Tax=Dendrobium catenatum TaxID=906689 RepID=A0A2I0X624_9ASPA|nr:hypothetical protein MA16_Dca023292 [Dendrobium catenatum]
MNLEVCGDIDKGVDDNLSLIPSGEFTLVSSHVEVVNNDVCDVNTMVLIDSSSGLVISSHGCPLVDFEVALSHKKEVSNVNVSLIDVLSYFFYF